MQEMSRLRDTVALWRNLETHCRDLQELAALAAAEADPPLQRELEAETDALARQLAREEVRLTLAGPYDERPAIVTVHSGAGGTDSQDWTQMLLNMYVGWAQSTQRPIEIMDLSHGEEAGLRSGALEIGGRHAFGYLSAEQGVHRLVRLSPYDPNNLRHTSFANIEILPAVQSETDITLRPEDIKMDTFRSSGPGGQNVQKVASAVRLTHLPTGIIVSCQTERSQHQNREYAMRILRARLLKRQDQQRAQELALIRGQRNNPEWGHQIRSYVLHPYKSVKDHRTNLQSPDPETILQGAIDPFIEAYLMQKLTTTN